MVVTIAARPGSGVAMVDVVRSQPLRQFLKRWLQRLSEGEREVKEMEVTLRPNVSLALVLTSLLSVLSVVSLI
ncbi:unnamed protein product [Boreogadus saida]